MPAPDDSARSAKLQAVAQVCLHHLASDPAQLAGFLKSAGLTPDGLRAALGTDELAHGLLDYFIANEDLLLAMVANAGMQPDDITRLWQRLNQAD